VWSPIPPASARPAIVESDALLARQDGDPRTRRAGPAKPPITWSCFLLDGCNANLLTDVIASGDAPNIAALVADGTTFGHGVFASLPTATLANHTTALTGAQPGHSGVINHAWYDRERDAEVDLLSFEQMFHSSSHVEPSIETLFSAVARSRPGAYTSCQLRVLRHRGELLNLCPGSGWGDRRPARTRRGRPTSPTTPAFAATSTTSCHGLIT
jgi:hypothetical protein